MQLSPVAQDPSFTLETQSQSLFSRAWENFGIERIPSAAKQFAEKLEMKGFRVTQNASEISESAHIEFERDNFSSTSRVLSFSANCKAGIKGRSRMHR
jgi:hypothetical protein